MKITKFSFLPNCQKELCFHIEVFDNNCVLPEWVRFIGPIPIGRKLVFFGGWRGRYKDGIEDSGESPRSLMLQQAWVPLLISRRYIKDPFTEIVPFCLALQIRGLLEFFR